MSIALISLAAVLSILAIYAHTRRAPAATPRPRRFPSETAGIPSEAIDDYGTRRLARGSVPPMNVTQRLASSASLGSLALRPRLRPLTARSLDHRWDLSDRDRTDS